MSGLATKVWTMNFDASRMLAFDLETTSANPKDARIVTSAIVYNAAFDLTVLRSLTGDFTVTGPVFDPYVIDRVSDKWRKGKRTLGAVCEHYGVELGNAHEATADALAAARVAWKQVRQHYPNLAQMDENELMEFQAVKWYEDRVAFKKYLEGKGRDASDVSTAWPLIS